MNWFILILVFHVLKLSVCIASNQVCPVGQFLNASGVCVNCTVCKESEKGVTIRPCSSRADALCGSVSDLKVNLPSMKKPKNQLDFAYKFLDLNAVADLSKDNITTFLNKYSKTPSPPKSADKLLKDDNYYDYLEEDDDDDDDYDGEEISSSSNIIETSNVKSSTKNLDKPVKKSKNKSTKDFASSKDSFLELSLEPSKNGKQIKKDLNINTLDTVNKTAKPVKYSVSKYPAVDEEVTVIDPDSFKKKFAKDTKKSKSKKKDQVEVNDHSLKIANTKFVIDINDDDKSDDDGRWLRLSHPHIVDQKIYVDLANDNPSKDKKASTFFSSSEKLENQHRDQEYANEMTKLLNETSSILNTTTNILNQTIASKVIPNDETFDNTLTKNLDDEDDDDEDEDDEDEDEDDDDDDDDKDDDDDEDEDDDDNDDYNFIYNDVLGRNATNKLPQNVEKVDVDMDDEYDLLENDNLEDKKWYPATNDVNPDIIAEPFVSTANWQILVLVSAMSACLLFFIVVSTYVCIYMRKRRQFKTNFEADVEDLSVRVNLMQHAGFEADDTSNIKNYITQLRGVKLNNEKVPKLCTRNK